jgi:hypothetical protein
MGNFLCFQISKQADKLHLYIKVDKFNDPGAALTDR